MDIVMAVGLVIVAGIVSALVGAMFVWIFWDWVMPPVFGLPTITYWQALALALLCEVLFKSHKSRSKG